MDRTGAPSRRQLLGLAGMGLAGLAGLATGCTTPPTDLAAAANRPTEAQPKPDQAWLKLADGNDRFASGKPVHPHQDVERWKQLANGQRPFGCVLGCIDSRVPPELVFDQGIGDLLTVRSAGEVLDDAVVGSVEYGVVHLGIPLVVVLGHVDCGAVQAAVELVHEGGHPRGELSTVVHMIEGAVRATRPDDDEDRFLRACVAEQVRRVVAELRERSYAVDAAVDEGRLLLKPMVYDVRTGRVDNA